MRGLWRLLAVVLVAVHTTQWGDGGLFRREGAIGREREGSKGRAGEGEGDGEKWEGEDEEGVVRGVSRVSYKPLAGWLDTFDVGGTMFFLDIQNGMRRVLVLLLVLYRMLAG